MSVSLRVTGAWAELVADGSVAIPATPQAGDRMYLFARWKDFSVTATVANWTELVEFSDGAVSTGNGTGSVKVGCWYRDWQPGDTDPTIDFSAAPENASVVITVMAKGADDVWLTPVAVTAAMTNWTTTSQIVSASSTAAVKSDGVVMALIGLRDDSAIMTRPTTGIDDSVAAVTWNGNYVESPATHHSTTTGDDGAADLGYRLVATGATATLRMTGTISAAETGSALWVVQGISVVVTPGIAALTLASFAPSLRTTATPPTATLSVTSFAPQLHERTIPATTTLSLATSAPVLNQAIVPSAASFTLGSFAPGLHEQVTPSTVNLTLTSFAPTPSILFTVIPDSASLTITTQGVLLNESFSPATASLAIAAFRPSVLPFNIVYLDPGGDAVQAVGYFNTLLAGSTGVSYDTAQKKVGAGSYKFDSLTGVEGQQGVSVAGVMSHNPAAFAPRRFSCNFRYDSVPDVTETVTKFVGSSAIYSAGGFSDLGDLSTDDGVYDTATPAKNAGQGTVFGLFGFDSEIPIDAAIDSVKIIYERKYDVDTSIGISRVKYRIDGIEGPDYDNTDQPLTDTVVTVDLTPDRGFTRAELLDTVFEVIAEARRGDSDTGHTQSWDYVKVEVVWHLDGIISVRDSTDAADSFKLGLSRHGSEARLRFIDGSGASFLGITPLLPDTWNRISFGYIQRDSSGISDLDINIYVNGIPELLLVDLSTDGAPIFNLRYGWLDNPGAGHLCWFDIPYIDEGDDLYDTVFGPEFRPPYSTAKLPATVNENTWNTTVGTGAVNERPLSITNHMKETGTSGARQSYTLQAASVGDIDISGETLIGHMGWAWAKSANNDTVEAVSLIVNGVDIDRTLALVQGSSGVPLLLKSPHVSSFYPSDDAGIGMTGNLDSADIFLYECGAVVAYEGLAEEMLLPYQLVDNETLPTIVDDLRSDPPDSYEVCCRFDDFGGTVEIVIHSLDQDGGSVQYRGTLYSTGRTRITPGVEVYLDVTVTGVTMLQIWRRMNVD